MKDRLSLVIKLLLFIVFIALVIVGQTQIGYGHLAMMLTGLAGLIVLLYSYNRKYR